MSKMPATLVCKLNISRQFKLKYTVIIRSDICAPEPAQIHRKSLYLSSQTASISKLSATPTERPYYYQLTDKISTTHRTLQHICKLHKANAQPQAFKRAAILPPHPSPPTTLT